MIIERADGTLQCGPLDVVCILHDVKSGRYHAAFFEEKPLPGPVEAVEETEVVRLKSKMHHTTGTAELASARVHLRDLVTKLNVPQKNIWEDPIDWDGELGLVWVVQNWLT